MRKNILIFGHNYATQFIDVYNQYARLFDKKSYNVTIAYMTGKYDAEVERRTLAENIIFLDLPKKHIRYFKIHAIKKMLQLTRKQQFEIVICHRYKPSYIMMWVAKFCKIPAIICVMHELKSLSPLARRISIAFLQGKNTLFAGVSNAVRDDMRRDLPFIPQDRIVTLYNMIDTVATEPAILSREEAREILQIQPHEFVFGNIARLAPNKNQQRLLSAFAKIKKNCPHAKLIIMGDGGLEPVLKQQIENLNLQKSVILAGFVPLAFRYMRAFDCFVLPSTQEAFGRVLLEAMLAKCIIIAGKVHGIPEVLNTTGILINPQNIDELVDAMQKAYEYHNDTINLAENAYDRVKNEFAIPNFIQQFWSQPLLQTIGKP